ncbi:unnamed protein product, partial [Staurois parvus]
MQGPGRVDIVNAGSGESGYSECRAEASLGLVSPGANGSDLRIEHNGSDFDPLCSIRRSDPSCGDRR